MGCISDVSKSDRHVVGMNQERILFGVVLGILSGRKSVGRKYKLRSSRFGIQGNLNGIGTRLDGTKKNNC